MLCFPVWLHGGTVVSLLLWGNTGTVFFSLAHWITKLALKTWAVNGTTVKILFMLQSSWEMLRLLWEPFKVISSASTKYFLGQISHFGSQKILQTLHLSKKKTFLSQPLWLEEKNLQKLPMLLRYLAFLDTEPLQLVKCLWNVHEQVTLFVCNFFGRCQSVIGYSSLGVRQNSINQRCNGLQWTMSMSSDSIRMF